MKREKSFYYFLVMIAYVVCFCASLILACRTVIVGKLTPTGAFIVYPITYFLAILFAERYGKKDAKMMFNYALFGFVTMVLFITISSTLSVPNGTDGLEPIFNLNFRLVFASLASFYVSQHLNLLIYYYITGFRGFKFLISGVIAATVDSIIFTFLAFIGELEFSIVLQKFTSQYVLNVFMIIIYTILFTYLIDTNITTRDKNLEAEVKEIEPKKVSTVKKTTTTSAKPKTSASKKRTPVKKTTVKKETTKKETK